MGNLIKINHLQSKKNVTVGNLEICYGILNSNSNAYCFFVDFYVNKYCEKKNGRSEHKMYIFTFSRRLHTNNDYTIITRRIY